MAKVKSYGPEYQQFNTSDEILYALEKTFGVIEFDDDGEPYPCETITQWEDPTKKFIKQIEDLAWSVASPDTKKLYWGDTEIKRPS